MKNKKDISRLISSLKKEVKKSEGKSEEKIPPGAIRERDMRQEAIDMDSHGAREYFMGGTA